MGSAAAFSPPSPPRPAPEAGADLPRPPPQPAGGARRGRGRPQEQEKLGEPPPHRRRPQPWGPRARGSQWEGMASWSSPPPLLPGGTPVTKLGHGEPTEARVEGGGRDQSSVRPCQTGSFWTRDRPARGAPVPLEENKVLSRPHGPRLSGREGAVAGAPRCAGGGAPGCARAASSAAARTALHPVSGRPAGRCGHGRRPQPQPGLAAPRRPTLGQVLPSPHWSLRPHSTSGVLCVL